VGRDGSSWAVRASGGFVRMPAAGCAIRQESTADEAPAASAAASRELAPFLRPLSRKRRVTVGPSCQQARRHAGSCRPGNGEQSSRHGGALRKRHAASSCSLRAGGTHRWDRLIPFGVSSKPGSSGASCARRAIDGFGPVDPGNWSLLCFMHTSRRGRRVAPATPVRPGRPDPGSGRKPRTASSLRKGRGERSRMRRPPVGGRDRMPGVRATVRHRLRWICDRDPAQRCISARRQDLAVYRRARCCAPHSVVQLGRCLAICLRCDLCGTLGCLEGPSATRV